MDEVYVALIVGFLFFICKVILNKLQKEFPLKKEWPQVKKLQTPWRFFYQIDHPIPPDNLFMLMEDMFI